MPGMLVNQAARERIVQVLSRHFANDVISMEEFEARVARVYAAATPDDLAAVVADLPADDPSPATMPEATASTQRIVATLSGQERQLTGAVPRRLDVRSRLGYVELDLTRATFAPGVTEIDVRVFMGYAQIHLPAGVRVECLGSAFGGFFSAKGGGAEGDTDSPVTVRITGRAVFGFVENLSRRRLPSSV